ADTDRHDFESHEKRVRSVMRSTVAVGVILDLNIFPAASDLFLPGLCKGISKIHKEPLASHLQYAQAGPPGCKLEITIHVSAGMDNFEVLVDEDGTWRVLTQEAPVELLLGLQIIPCRFHGFRWNTDHSIFRAVCRVVQRKTDRLAHGGGLFRKDFVGAVRCREETAGRTDSLGTAEHEESPGPRSVVEQSDDFVLQQGLEINEKVAAANQIHLGKRRIVQDVVLRKNAHVTNGFADAVAALDLGKETPQPLR